MPQTDFDFDQLPERRGTGAIKWDRYPDSIPYWVADMDFPSPDCIIQALHQRVDHGVFGYANAHDSLNEALLNYLSSSHGVTVESTAIVHLPGLVPALSLACRAFAAPGDEVMINSPVYYPFHLVGKDAGAQVIDVPHIRDEQTWRFDWEAMERAVTAKTKVLIFCNPQNPLGRAFSEQEVMQMADFCERHDLVFVSDEIHCDLILEPEEKHFSALKLPAKLRERCITLMAPSKTYNIAGLGYSFAIIENDSLRRKFIQARGCTLPEINALAMYAAEAAYRFGEPWRQDLLAYLKGNRDTLAAFVRSEMPRIGIHEHSATYLYWMDCSSLKQPQPATFFAKHAGVFLSDGSPFGSAKHVRFNFGCPREHMLKGLEAMALACRQLPSD